MPAPLLPEDAEVLAATPARTWDDLRGARVLVTGGTGFVGTWLLAALAWANRELALDATAVVVSRDPAAFLLREPWVGEEAWIVLIPGDVRSLVAPSGRFSHVVAGAAPADARVAAKAPFTLMETIVEGCARTLRAAGGAGARGVLLLSSGAVYGRGSERLTHTPEDFEGVVERLDSRFAYHEAKRAMEALGAAAGAQSNFEVKLARLFAFVGPWLPLDRHFAVGNFIRDGLAGGPIVVRGDGTPERSFLYAADMAVWLLTILTCGADGRAYNVGSERSVSVAELAGLVANTLPQRPAVEIRGVAQFGGGGQRYVPSVRRARDELGLAETVDLADGLGRTVRWFDLRRQHSR
jgi:dTDP-glucose 4,6-dehydratase